MNSFSQRSLNKLSTCHPDLQMLFTHVVKYYDCTVLSGHRGEEEQNELVHIYVEQAKRYAKDVGITSEWPLKYALEDIRLKKYYPNDLDQFPPHVDVGDNRNCTRFLVFFVYLNDNEGGKTTFPKLGIESPCKKGNMVMFPPMWTHLHAATKPIAKPKYMCGSYLHYVSKDL